jgi:protein-serine/threonine kinase
MNLQVSYDNKIDISRVLKKLLEALLNKNNNARLGFKYGSYEIKNHIFFKDVKFQLIMNVKPPYVP